MQPTSSAMPYPTPSTTRPGRAALWSGWLLTGLVVAMLVMSATMKLTGGPEMAAGLVHLGFESDIPVKLAIIEFTCVLLYLLPHTAVLGAVLVTGYLGGAMSVHLRVGDPVTTPLVLGIVAWAGLYLRDPRLRRLLPLRSL